MPLLLCPRQQNCGIPRSGVHIHYHDYSVAGCIEITHNTSCSICNSLIDFKNQIARAYINVVPSTEGQIHKMLVGFVYIDDIVTRSNKTMFSCDCQKLSLIIEL